MSTLGSATHHANRRQALLQQRQDEREALLATIEAALRDDGRVIAAWLAGSLGRGDADAFSDIDLWIIVDDDAVSAIAAAPPTFVARIVVPCLVIEAPQNAPPDGAYLFTHVPGETGAHQVDWYWQAASRASRPKATKLLFERVSIPVEAAPSPLPDAALAAQLTAQLDEFWAVVLLAAKSIARGKHRSVHRNFEYLDQIERTVRWLLDHSAPPGFDDLRHSSLPDVLPVTAEERLRFLNNVLNRFAAMEPELRQRGVAPPGEARLQVLRWLAFIRSLSVS